MIQIAASLMAANPLHLAQELQAMESLVDRVHLDVMDGHFVPNLALASDTVRAIPASWQRDIHLMVEQPAVVAEWLDIRAGDTVYFHPQTLPNFDAFIETLITMGAVPGFAINLDFDLEKHVSILSEVDHFLVMGIKPGFSGQQMSPETIERVKWLHDRFPQATIAIDGGVNDTNAQALIAAGATILVTGSYLFEAKDKEKAVERLRITDY